MTEYELIQSMAAKFPRSPDQSNRLFECDAEIVRIGDAVWGMTMDDFSPEEDLFTSATPVTLGANLAVATLSDLLAAGVEPRFFMHAISLPRHRPDGFAEGLTDGIRDVLSRAGCFLCGGDLGAADTWRYVGFAMGPVAARQPLTRKLPAAPQTLWVTGCLGDANRSALTNEPTPAFELRMAEAALIRRHATGCIDTSGGLMDAVWLLHRCSPGLCINLHADAIPLAPGLTNLAALAGIPAEAALVGGAGEYELLFALPAEQDAAARRELEAAGMTAIGAITPDPANTVHVHRHGRRIGTMTTPPPCPRAAANLPAHIREVALFAAGLFGHTPPS